MNDVLNVTATQIDDMKHCIGFAIQRVKRGKYKAYRNRYIASDDNRGWDDLVSKGLARKQSFKNGSGENPQLYYLSEEGFRFLGGLLEVKITEMD
ncbi:hypothetical protein Desde_1067 [Desulfitobacterium dehalogenans ATCC 51507]|uniref:Uncharacterized protein n=1 Tax=Desulfitobacterium dehalogenans (strain ATCC 51507 / DSM 9161 / JW/IU-DC1) TaxID=756499 RepID=I4A6B5_DESDJ|nr:hypothetical protein [Desulfitobacterium dehalogenans]AFL99499.1 hypothetical protein Desde_1067 [Desulfitobacterium dehalogenans ATCC 51507]